MKIIIPIFIVLLGIFQLYEYFDLKDVNNKYLFIVNGILLIVVGITVFLRKSSKK